MKKIAKKIPGLRTVKSAFNRWVNGSPAAILWCSWESHLSGAGIVHWTDNNHLMIDEDQLPGKLKFYWWGEETVKHTRGNVYQCAFLRGTAPLNFFLLPKSVYIHPAPFKTNIFTELSLPKWDSQTKFLRTRYSRTGPNCQYTEYTEFTLQLKV